MSETISPNETTTTVATPTHMENADEIKTVHKEKETITSTATKEIKETSIPKTYIQIIMSNPLYSDVSKVLHWRDPVKTGLLFGIFNFFFFLQTWADYSFVTIISYLLLTLLCICFGYSNYVVLKASWIQGQQVENPFKERFKDAKFHVSRKTAEEHLVTVLDIVNLTIDNLRDIFYCTDNFLSLRFLVYFYVGAMIGDWFSGATLVYLVTLGFFIWPRLYEEKQKEIDHFKKLALAQATVYYNLALTKIPPAVTARFPQLKPKSN
jgi:hypothetical protein